MSNPSTSESPDAVVLQTADGVPLVRDGRYHFIDRGGFNGEPAVRSCKVQALTDKGALIRYDDGGGIVRVLAHGLYVDRCYAESALAAEGDSDAE